MTLIYKLICPETKEVKYIGKTKDSVQKRLAGHISYALRKRHLQGKHEWIRNLYYSNRIPITEVIEECEDSVWQEREKYWIDFYSKTCELFNKTKGGEDFVFKSGNTPWNKGGGMYSDESRLKMSNSAKNKVIYESHKQNTSKTFKEKGIKPNLKALENSRKSKIKKILEYDLQGNFIREWNSVIEAASFHNGYTTAISKCCQGQIKTYKQRIFKYYNNNYQLTIDINLEVITRQVIVTDLVNNQYIFKNTREASIWLMNQLTNKIPKNYTNIIGNIRKACNEESKYRNFYWKYLNKI